MTLDNHCACRVAHHLKAGLLSRTVKEMDLKFDFKSDIDLCLLLDQEKTSFTQLYHDIAMNSFT
jgi:hypothetical protein